MLAIAIILSLGSLACWIMVLVKIFPESVGLGILGIVCPLFAFIYGWNKSAQWGIQKLMTIWSVLVVAGIIVRFALASPVGR